MDRDAFNMRFKLEELRLQLAELDQEREKLMERITRIENIRDGGVLGPEFDKYEREDRNGSR